MTRSHPGHHNMIGTRVHDGPAEDCNECAHLVDIEAVSELLDVKRETVRMWRHREILPEPEWYLNGGPIWRWATIEQWAKETRRL